MSFRAWVSARFFLFFLTWSVYLAYWAVWLLGSGEFDEQQVGVILTAGLVARAVAVAWIFPWLCRLATLWRLSQALAWSAAIFSLLYLAPAEMGSMVAISVLVGCCYPLVMPLNETLATVGVRKGLMDYGNVRYWGSAGFIVGLVAAGLIEGRIGSSSLILLFVGGCFLLAVTSLIRPRGLVLERSGPAGGGYRRLIGNRPFVLSLTISILLQAAHAMYYAFGAVHFGALGFSHLSVSFLLIIAVAAEMVLFKNASRLAGEASLPVLFSITTAVSVLRWGLLAMPLPGVVLAITQVLHAITFALTHVAYAQCVQRFVPAELWPTAHGLYASLAMSLGIGMMTFVGSLLYQSSSSWAFLAMAVVCLPCVVLARRLAVNLRQPLPAAAG